MTAQVVLATAAVVAAVGLPARPRNAVAGTLSATVGVAGLVTGAAVVAGHNGSLGLTSALPVAGVALDPDPLGGFVMAVAGAVGAVGAVFAIGYAHGPSASRTSWAALPAFLVSMQLVPAAGDAVSFLLMWEMMAITSTMLVLAEHRAREDVRSAALWYAAMTHLSFVLLMLGFAVLTADAGGIGFEAMSAVDPASPQASLAFGLLIVGFVTKAGAVPFHVWLPRAHPAAPSHVSAVMSAAMVKMGVYGVLLVALRLLPDGPTWWGLVVLALGALSATYGILQASVTSDLKRLLAFSTTENVGLMFLALGTAMLLRSYGVSAAAEAALVACLLLLTSHAAFKTALFLGAGAVLHATGERDLDRLGGLGTRMPVTHLAFGLGALGAAALPVSSGFVAEWTLLQSMIHGARPEDRLVAAMMPISVSVVALTAGLALLTFVKAYGIAFLARPRSSSASDAREVTPGMCAAMLVAAVAVVGLGLVPGPIAEIAGRAVGVADPGSGVAIELPGIVGGVLDPVAVTALAALLAVPVGVVALAAARRRRRRGVDLAWGCGGVRVSPRMQYTATSYAEPLARVFDDAVRPERDVVVTHSSESRYLVERVQFRQHLDEIVEARLYRPVLRAGDRVGVVARGLQNGSIHRYLGYSFLALVAVLVVVAL
jgi:formate hydrogenlyase subunit 3/multisubunit Na+/H+ antiporter MnhD subunit